MDRRTFYTTPVQPESQGIAFALKVKRRFCDAGSVNLETKSMNENFKAWTFFIAFTAGAWFVLDVALPTLATGIGLLLGDQFKSFMGAPLGYLYAGGWLGFIFWLFSKSDGKELDHGLGVFFILILVSGVQSLIWPISWPVMYFNASNEGSFEQQKIENSAVTTTQKYADSYPVTQSAPRLNSDTEVRINTTRDKPISRTLLTEKIEGSRASLKISSMVHILKAACKSIEAGKALRPQENLKLIIADITKLQRRKYLDIPQLIELKLQLENIRVRFDPFGEKYVWDQLGLGCEIMQEIIDLNFEEFE
jgi:hypothetical protein